MSEWITEYFEDVDGILDGTYCFEEECPPEAQGLAQTEFLPIANYTLGQYLMDNSDHEVVQNALVGAFLGGLRSAIVGAFSP